MTPDELPELPPGKGSCVAVDDDGNVVFPKAEPSRKVYLGDSVYADFKYGSIILTTENGYPDDPRNKIVLELEVYQALLAYVKSIIEGMKR